MDFKEAKQFVALETEIATLNARLKTAKQEQDELEREIVADMVGEGLQKVTVDGRTLSVVPAIFASPVDGDKEAVIVALKDAELGQYVQEQFNPASLRAYVKEIAKEVEQVCKGEGVPMTAERIAAALPGTLGTAVKVSIVYELSSRKA
jgi:hypothetical protein